MIINDINIFIESLQKEGAILAIDHGSKKIGLAISDSSRLLSVPLANIKEEKTEKQIAAIKKFTNDYSFAAIIIGLPMNIMGDETDQSLIIRKFAKRLDLQFKVPIMLYDERFTSRIANNLLKMQGFNRKERNESDDKIAASLLLESFLTKLKEYTNKIDN
jgi:putative Holliday junction resolvase